MRTLAAVLLVTASLSGQAIYPDSIITDAQATLQTNTSSFGPKTLTATISPTATSLTINDSTGLNTPGVVWIQSEAIKVASAASGVLTVWTAGPLTVTDCLSATPAVIVTAADHNLTGNERVTITGSSDSACNVSNNRINRTSATTFELVGVSSTGGTGGSANATGRGYDGTTQASHTAGRLVQALAVASHYNQLLREVQALEAGSAAGVTFPIRAPNSGIISWKDSAGTDNTVLQSINGRMLIGHQVAPVSNGDTYIFSTSGSTEAGVHLQARSDNVMVLRPMAAADCPLCTQRGFLGDNNQPWEAYIGIGANLLTTPSASAQLLIEDRTDADGLETYVYLFGAPNGAGGTYALSLPSGPPNPGDVMQSTGLDGSGIHVLAWTPGGGGGGSSPPFTDTNDLIQGSGDATKRMRFEVDGLSSGVTRVLTPQNSSYTLAGTNVNNNYTAEQRYSANIAFNLNNVYNIGSPSSAASTIYAATLISSPKFRISSSFGSYYDLIAGPGLNTFRLLDNSAAPILQYANGVGQEEWTFVGHTQPGANLAYDSGKSYLRWRSVWTGTFNASGVSTFSSAATFAGGVTIPVGSSSIIDVGAGDLGVGTTGNFFGRYTGAASSTVNCNPGVAVRDGWQAITSDNYFVTCRSGTRYRVALTSY